MPEIITKAITTPKGLIEFGFEPLHFNGNTIFAVYCNYGGVAHCFHLSQHDDTEFALMDMQNCPYDFHNFEHLLSDAIYQFQS